jgi:glycosyltransferase involved in cell wall biosynthesis
MSSTPESTQSSTTANRDAKRPIRVLCVTLHGDRAEAATFVGLQKNGCEVCVYCRPESPYIATFEAAGIRVVTYPFRKHIDREAIRLLREELRDGDYDIVHLLHNRPVSNGLRAVKGFPKPKVVVYRGIVGNVSRFNPSSRQRYLHPRIDRIICVAEAVRRYFIDRGLFGSLLPRDKVVTIYKGHDVAWYRDAPADLAQFDIPAGAFVIGCVATMRPRKGIEVLVEAFSKLPADVGAYLLLVGKMESARLDGAIAASPNAARIRKVGVRRDAPAIIAACDVSVLPTLRREGLPKTVIEAMIHEVPPIVTNTGGSPELVENGVSGLVVPPGDAAALTEAMLRLYHDPDLRRRIGQAARRRIETHFNSARTVEQTLTLYRELLGSQSPSL